MIQKIHAIVLNTRKFGDSSLIANLLSLELGKIAIICKGAFNPKTNLSAFLQTGNSILAEIYYKNSTEIHLVKSLELNKLRNEITKNFDLMKYQIILLEIYDKTHSINETNQEIYDLIDFALDKINEYPNFSEFYLISFLIENIKNLGYSLNDENNLGNYFNPNNGKFTILGNEAFYLNDSKKGIFVSCLNRKELEISKNDLVKFIEILIKYLERHLTKKITINSLYLLDM